MASLCHLPFNELSVGIGSVQSAVSDVYSFLFVISQVCNDIQVYLKLFLLIYKTLLISKSLIKTNFIIQFSLCNKSLQYF